jgi:NADH-quinone oxidoreductase subunit M
MEVQVLCLVLMLIGFGMRLPLVPLHRWFVEVMTEATAPVALMVAGAGAATATYGLLRFGMYAFPDAGRMLLGPLLVLALLSMVYGAFLAIRQDDLRRVVAYVFVAEGGIILLGISGASESGFAGAVFGTIARGLGAGALVLLIAALQDRFRTRSLALFGGLATRLPSLFGLWLLAVLLGAGVPASAGFVGNVVTVMGAFPVHHRATVVAVLLLGVLLAILLWVLHRIFLQPAVDEAQRLHDATSLERWAVGLLLAGSLYIGIFPQGPLLAENHLMEPGLMNAVTDGVRQIADRYVHGATSALP